VPKSFSHIKEGIDETLSNPFFRYLPQVHEGFGNRGICRIPATIPSALGQSDRFVK